ncbi:TPA: YaiO family outer membrane beta-barrel protein [Stenotrophomonas maltophilia]|nr:YaiO family outer membrane beta-barrel protein [Stenotrophomonas maltophilia]HDS1024807.1 YaiO family outer membrane beta-barrel protein [Stenotrophomonas maltophilia]HDS1028851.1 YaiO family outer membrane beta-barrel protein [Stenotrophomonas maltophilia]HDS1032973.1 YaiO family outer membrane beta-barrel protein [Stenotrophomonas maltophilia]
MRLISHGILPCALLLATASAHAGVDRVSLQLDHADYSDGFGKRDVQTLDVAGRSGDSRWHLGLAHGERDYGSARFSGNRVQGSLHHAWSPTVSTRTAFIASNDDPVFVNRQVNQDLQWKVAPQTVLSVGGKYAEYHAGAYVHGWSVGAAYYFPQVTASIRHERHSQSNGPDGYGTTLSLRLKDTQGRGSTQLWLGSGTSGYSAEADPLLLREHDARRLFVRRNQPLGEHLMLEAGLGKTWHKTRLDRFQSVQSHLGLGYHW